MKDTGKKIYQVVYRSTATTMPSKDEILKILETARQKNESHGVTGLLMVRGNVFIQLLEGEKSAVHETLKRIKTDKRHSNIKILLEGLGQGRMFKKWSMGFIDEESFHTSTSEALDMIDKVSQSPGELHGLVLKILSIYSHDTPSISQPKAV